MNILSLRTSAATFGLLLLFSLPAAADDDPESGPDWHALYETAELRYVEYPGVQHNSWTQTFARDDVFEWLFSKQRLSDQATASQ
jgi:hypothetical protein